MFAPRGENRKIEEGFPVALSGDRFFSSTVIVFVYLFRLPVETYRNANDGNHVSVNVAANVSLLERVEFVGSSLEERFIVRLTLIV